MMVVFFDDLQETSTRDLIATARLLEGAADQAPTLARLLATALRTEALHRLDAVETRILSRVRAAVLPEDLPPAEVATVETMLAGWLDTLRADGIEHPIARLVERLDDQLLRLRGRHAQAAAALARLVEGAEGDA